MAEITRASSVSIASTMLQAEDKLPDLPAGEDILIGQPCYVKSDGTIWRSTGAAATAPANVHGWALNSAKVAQGQTVTLAKRVKFTYATSLTPGKTYYLSGTIVGGIADAASTGGTTPIAHAIDTTRIECKASFVY